MGLELFPANQREVGYPLTQFSIRPFVDHDLTNDDEESAAWCHWNHGLSALRVRVEHAFGWLKGRFPALQALQGYELKAMWETVEALLIVHNILTAFGDNPHDIQGFNGEEDADPNPNEAQEEDLVQNSRGQMQMNENDL